jgi:hypothetical protein
VHKPRRWLTENILQPWPPLTVKAKLAGLWVDKAENKANNVVYHIADKPMTMDEWAQKWCSAGENVSN